MSLQLHIKRSKHRVGITGTAKVIRGDEIYLVRTNESTYIPINVIHRLENSWEELLYINEVQNGEYIEEDDIERLSDDYGRT